MVLLVIVSPWCLGGVLASTQVWIFATALLALACWGLALVTKPKQTVNIPLAVVPLILMLALGGFQILPQVDEVHDLLAPHGAELQRSLQSELNPSDSAMALQMRLDNPSTWHPISLYPAATRQTLAMLTLGLAVFMMGWGLFYRSQAQVWLFAAIAVNGAALALFGIVQRLTFNGKLFWQIPLTRGGAPFGPFVNQNNAGGFLDLCLAGGVGLTIWALARNGFLQAPSAPTAEQAESRAILWRPWRALREFLLHLRPLSIAAMTLTTCILAGVVCSLSRGAILAMLGGGAVTIGALLLTQRWNRRLSWLGLLAVAAITLVSWLGMSRMIGQRFIAIPVDAVARTSRYTNWCDALRAVPDFWFLGSGLGTYRFVYGLYQAIPGDAAYEHAENQYLETLLEGGVIALGIAISMALILGAAILRLLQVSERGRTLTIGIVGCFAISSEALASVFDFGLCIPANLLLFSLLCGVIAGRAAEVASKQSWSRLLVLSRRPLAAKFLAFVCLLLLFGALAETMRVARIEACLKATELARQDDKTSVGKLREAARVMQTAVDQRPDDAEARQELAAIWVERYRRSVLELLLNRSGSAANREALQAAATLLALHGRFFDEADPKKVEAALAKVRSDPDVQDNLLPALQQLIQSRRACALLPQVHLLISQLAGVASEPGEDEVHIQRARRADPVDPATLFLCGVLEFQAKRLDSAYDCWRQSLSCGRTYLPQILRFVEPQLALPNTIEKVFPDDPSLLLKFARETYSEQRRAPIREAFLKRIAALANDSQCAEEQRHHLLGALAALRGEYRMAIGHYERALDLADGQAEWRSDLARALQHEGRLEEAFVQARACRMQAPADENYRKLFADIEQARLMARPGGSQ